MTTALLEIQSVLILKYILFIRFWSLLPDPACSWRPPCWSGYKPQSALDSGVEESHCWRGLPMSGIEIWKCGCIRRILYSKSKIIQKINKYKKKPLQHFSPQLHNNNWFSTDMDYRHVNLHHCTLTVPSDEALRMWNPSWVKDASFTNDEWPFNSLSVLPDLNSWILKMTLKNLIC